MVGYVGEVAGVSVVLGGSGYLCVLVRLSFFGLRLICVGGVWF